MRIYFSKIKTRFKKTLKGLIRDQKTWNFSGLRSRDLEKVLTRIQIPKVLTSKLSFNLHKMMIPEQKNVIFSTSASKIIPKRTLFLEKTLLQWKKTAC